MTRRKNPNKNALANQMLLKGKYDDFIIDNIYYLTTTQMCKIIKVDSKFLEQRISELTQMKKIGKHDKAEHSNNVSIRIGNKYKIFEPDGHKKADSLSFSGTCIQKQKNYYVFESESGYKECFLKADFITGEKIISKA
jgi:hypothetical protein